MSHSRTIRATGELIGDAFAGVVDTVWDVHQAIARRSLAALGPAAAPARARYDRVTTGVYRAVRGAHVLPRVASAVVGAGVGLFGPAPRPSGRSAGLALGLLNGWAGDDLGGRHEALALGMTLHWRRSRWR
jgi:hypothetical protein